MTGIAAVGSTIFAMIASTRAEPPEWETQIEIVAKVL